MPLIFTASASALCNLTVLALFEDLTTGLATGLRHAFSVESGGLSPRLCIVRDLTLCATVKSTYNVSSPVNIAETDERGGWTGRFLAPLESLEAARIVTHAAGGGARAAPAARALAASYSATDTNALQALLNAASTGVFVVAVAVTTSKADAGVVAACLLTNACADGNSSRAVALNMSATDAGAASALADAAGAQTGALVTARLASTVGFVISALANATGAAPAAFTAFVNLSGATVSSERVVPAAAADGRATAPSAAAAEAVPAAATTGGVLGALGLLGVIAWTQRRRIGALAGRLLSMLGRGGADHGASGPGAHKAGPELAGVVPSQPQAHVALRVAA